MSFLNDRDQYTKLSDQKSFIRIVNRSIVPMPGIEQKLFLKLLGVYLQNDLGTHKQAEYTHLYAINVYIYRTRLRSKVYLWTTAIDLPGNSPLTDSLLCNLGWLLHFQFRH